MQARLILESGQSPGDIVMLTAAVRDLRTAHPNIHVEPRTTAMPLWNHNPFVEHFPAADGSVHLPVYTDDGDGERRHPDAVPLAEAPKVIAAMSAAGQVVRLRMKYPLIHRSNQEPWHFIHGYRKYLESVLGLDIPMGPFRGDIHLAEDEQSWIHQVEETTGWKGPFWVLFAGGKKDFTAKWWEGDRWQAVVDHFKGRVLFVQVGEEHHFHRPLRGVVNFLGKTDTRQLVRLIHHADGVLCPVTFGMHLAAAVPPRKGRPKNRACVVVAGGREPAQWEAYPHHRFLSVNGAMMCCDNGGCWKSRCQQVFDLDEKDKPENLCPFPVKVSHTALDGKGTQFYNIPRCMDMIRAGDVIRAIELYHEGGALQYADTAKVKVTP